MGDAGAGMLPASMFSPVRVANSGVKPPFGGLTAAGDVGVSEAGFSPALCGRAPTCAAVIAAAGDDAGSGGGTAWLISVSAAAVGLLPAKLRRRKLARSSKRGMGLGRTG